MSQSSREGGRERASCIMSVPLPLFTHVQHVTESRKPPQSKIHAREDVLLYLYHTLTHTHTRSCSLPLYPCGNLRSSSHLTLHENWTLEWHTGVNRSSPYLSCKPMSTGCRACVISRPDCLIVCFNGISMAVLTGPFCTSQMLILVF